MAYEECRADAVALYFMNFKEPYEIFFPDRKEEWDDIHYTGWLYMITQCVNSLKSYDPINKVFLQDHNRADWVILQALRQADPEFVEFTFYTDAGREHFVITLKRERLRTTVFKALTIFLGKLHIYKSIGDVEEARKFFDQYS